jgi:sporulation protein YlmC with PRC-barrel domain
MLSQAKQGYASFGAMARQVASELLVYAGAAVVAGCLFVAGAAVYAYVWPGKSMEPPTPLSPSIEVPKPPPRPIVDPPTGPATKPSAPNVLEGPLVSSAPPVSKIPGFSVYDKDGRLVGEIERVNLDHNGGPREIVVHLKGPLPGTIVTFAGREPFNKDTITVPIDLVRWKEPAAVAVIYPPQSEFSPYWGSEDFRAAPPLPQPGPPGVPPAWK